MPEELKTEDLCRVAVSNCGWALKYVPEEWRKEELCRVAVNQNINALSGYIPEQSRTIGLYVFALKKDAKALRYVPRDMRWDVLESVSKSDNVPLMIELIKDMKFRGHHIAPEWFKNGNTIGNGLAEDQEAVVSINDMRCYYEELSRILSVNGNNTLFTSPVSQIGGAEAGPAYPSVREETLYAEGSSGIAGCVRSFLF